MSLDLDERQRAMLQEIGIQVFWPTAAARAQEPVEEPLDEPLEATVAPVEAPVHARVPAPVQAPPPAVRPAPIAAAAAAPVRQLVGEVAGMDWQALAQAVAECRACGLCEGRTNAVFGVGDLQPDWMVIGESPGENEDLQGEPFLGDHGKLLDNMLAAVGARRGKGLYIANLLKCRPPGNRNPQPEEIAQCEPFLRRQVELLRPKVILAMGRFAVQTLLQSAEPVGKLRGRVHSYHGVPLVVTFHPAYLLRNLPDKAKAWADLCLAQEVMRGRVSAGKPPA
jgi:uracil-DNA glycosylase